MKKTLLFVSILFSTALVANPGAKVKFFDIGNVEAMNKKVQDKFIACKLGITPTCLSEVDPVEFEACKLANGTVNLSKASESDRSGIQTCMLKKCKTKKQVNRHDCSTTLLKKHFVTFQSSFKTFVSTIDFNLFQIIDKKCASKAKFKKSRASMIICYSKALGFLSSKACNNPKLSKNDKKTCSKLNRKTVLSASSSAASIGMMGMATKICKEHTDSIANGSSKSAMIKDCASFWVKLGKDHKGAIVAKVNKFKIKADKEKRKLLAMKAKQRMRTHTFKTTKLKLYRSLLKSCKKIKEECKFDYSKNIELDSKAMSTISIFNNYDYKRASIENKSFKQLEEK